MSRGQSRNNAKNYTLPLSISFEGKFIIESELWLFYFPSLSLHTNSPSGFLHPAWEDRPESSSFATTVGISWNMKTPNGRWQGFLVKGIYACMSLDFGVRPKTCTEKLKWARDNLWLGHVFYLKKTTYIFCLNKKNAWSRSGKWLVIYSLKKGKSFSNKHMIFLLTH